MDIVSMVGAHADGPGPWFPLVWIGVMIVFWTGVFLIVVAAGVFAYGLGDLQEAGLIPSGAHAYDISAAIPASSWYGTLAAGILNFNPSPTWLQVVGWVAYLAVVGFFYVRQHRAYGRPATTKPAAPRAAAPHAPIAS